MAERITGRGGATFKHWQSIGRPRSGQPADHVFLEGLRLCADAAASDAVIESALLADGAGEEARAFFDRLPDQVLRYTLPDQLFGALCDTERPQGLALVCRSPVIGQPAEPPRVNGLYLIAEAIQDPGNLGTMIRTADAFAYDGFIVTGGTVSPTNSKVMRAAMGSCFHIPLLAFPDVAAAAGWLGQSALPLIAADPQGTEVRLTGWPCGGALVIGNEAHGLSDQVRRLCSRLVRIPMPGRAESLNASVAAAILGYELMLARLPNIE